MEIEVKQPDGAFVKACVKSITPDRVEVTYDGGWKPDETVEYADCRISKLASKKSTVDKTFKVGDEVEACIKLKDSEVQQWKKAKISDIKGTFAVVQTLTEPVQTEIVSCECLRSLESTMPFIYENLQQLPIKVDSELHEHMKNPKVFKDLIEAIANIHIEFNESEGSLIFWSYFEKAIRQAKVLKDFFFKDLKQKISLLHRKEEVDKLETGGEEPARFVEEFPVLEELSGLVIGKRGTNVTNARAISGIKKIELINGRSDLYCFIKIHGDTQEAIGQARSMLEFVCEPVKVPREFVGKLIGRNGDMIQQIVDKSGTVRVFIQDNPESEGDNSDVVEFVFTGTKENVSIAELLVNYHLKQIRELDGLRNDIDRFQSNFRSNRGGRRNFNDRLDGRQSNEQRKKSVNENFKHDRNGMSDRSRNNFRSNRGGRRNFNGRLDGRQSNEQRKKSVDSDGNSNGGGAARRLRVSQTSE